MKTRITVKVQAKAVKTEYAGFHQGEYRIKVQAPRDKGEANRALVVFLSKKLQLPKTAITIVSGQMRAHKIMEIRGLDPETVHGRLNESA